MVFRNANRTFLCSISVPESFPSLLPRTSITGIVIKADGLGNAGKKREGRRMLRPILVVEDDRKIVNMMYSWQQTLMGSA